ncbi:O-fucosyltransferase 20 [Camellia lanceoleosa]|uniref:O-fucosyltransferase 20 n=1 Tax=Camellia lanceoleosa TaxID=1840588 RepID=A0ACC0IS21_9ERIC|nr:O-fucosyltransferase 20 [Camellia lanceoleosa]
MKNKKQEQEQSEFWKQPDGLGYKPCLDFTREYKKWSGEIVKDRKNYLMVVVSGGMNQQRNQIVDAVVIARILGAALVVPVLQVNVIWGDERSPSDLQKLRCKVAFQALKFGPPFLELGNKLTERMRSKDLILLFISD